MKCPHCVQRIHRTATSCPHCGYLLEDADGLFAGHERGRRCLTDDAGLLRRVERQRVEVELKRFGMRFPQLFFAVQTVALGDRTSLRQFGFWLLNRAEFEDLGEGVDRDGGILLVIDADSRTAGLSFGYRLDPFLSEADTFKCLSKAHPLLLEGDYQRGMVVVAREVGRLLRRRCWQARINPQRFEPRVRSGSRVGELVRRIRFGQQLGGEVNEAEA